MRLIFTLSPGRCGTQYLAKVLNTAPGIVARHEPKPGFMEMSVEAQKDQGIARKWLERVKLPAIELYKQMGADVYVETSHMVINGFVEPLLDLVGFDAIVLRRPREEVALSYWRKGSIPGRTPRGQNCLLVPERPNRMTNYELCLWHADETERLVQKYTPMIGKVVDTTLDEIATADGIVELCDRLDISYPTIPQMPPRHETPEELRSTFP